MCNGNTHDLNLCILSICLPILKTTSPHLHLQNQSPHHMAHSSFPFHHSWVWNQSPQQPLPQLGCLSWAGASHCPPCPAPWPGRRLSLAQYNRLGTELFRKKGRQIGRQHFGHFWWPIINHFLVFGNCHSKFALKNDLCIVIIKVPNYMINIWKTEKEKSHL